MYPVIMKLKIKGHPTARIFNSNYYFVLSMISIGGYKPTILD